MLKPRVEAALNDQLNQELAAGHEYLAMAAHLAAQNFNGFARFMLEQSGEEREHAMRIYEHILDRGGRPRLGAVPEPPAAYESPQAVFEAAYARERENTASIHALYKLAGEEDDYATQTMLHWFIAEQVEEEQWCEEALSLLGMAADNRSALLMLDGRYGKKVEKGG